MAFAWTSMPTPITHATTFLTQPLLLAHPASKIAALWVVLHSTLTTAFTSCSGPLILSLSPTTPPPQSIHAACIISNISWSNWIAALGGSTFELHISPSRVSVRMADGRSTTVWEFFSASPSVLLQTIGSVPAQRSSIVSVLRSSLRRRTRIPTLAQQLLESSHELKEADEIFSLLPGREISDMSPTPTRAMFSPTLTQGAFRDPSDASSVHVISFPEYDSGSDSEGDSRPSSRSSCISDISLSSFASSSQSSGSSITSVAPSVSYTKVEGGNGVVVDSTKATSTKYIYAGGLSTVLTGGVMLGSATTASASQNPAEERKPIVTAAVPVWMPKMRTRVPMGSDAENWRRVRRCAVGPRP